MYLNKPIKGGTLFNGISTFVGYLMPKSSFKKDFRGTI